MRKLFPAALTCLLLSACSTGWLHMPRVHKVTVQQGNVITQPMIDRLKPGMTRNQVLFVLGQPVMRNPFNDNRWDYVYTVEVPGQFQNQTYLSLFFENDRLASFSGNYTPTSAKEPEPEIAPEHIIADPPPEDTESANSGDVSAVDAP